MTEPLPGARRVTAVADVAGRESLTLWTVATRTCVFIVDLLEHRHVLRLTDDGIVLIEQVLRDPDDAVPLADAWERQFAIGHSWRRSAARVTS